MTPTPFFILHILYPTMYSPRLSTSARTSPDISSVVTTHTKFGLRGFEPPINSTKNYCDANFATAHRKK